ncbi:MAG: single-stranded-DNA-specific exonuclease RecJ [Planctomycetes bacterium]|nr:single-stranded-DNA-specific exonuclease RecJ [Planctomycetota bacterium]
MTRKCWRIAPRDLDRQHALQRAAGVSPIVAQLLLSRGVDTAETARLFLEAKLSNLRDPSLLPGVTAAAEAIYVAIEARERIVVYGDYDVDGMTATSILSQCLKLLGADVGTYVPSRMEEGYGLNDEALRTLAAQGAKLVITVDCGIASPSEAATAAQIGLKLIITDHHEPGPELPQAVALVHPRLPGTNYPFGGLCGAGVAFKLAWAICQRANNSTKVSERMRAFLVQAVGLAAIGTVADCVPLVDENRVLVQYGLRSLKENAGLGLTTLMKLANLADKPALDAEDIGFTIAPRLNAAGRLGQAQLGIELLTTTSESRATALAEYLNELNSSRQSLERSIYLAANKQAQEKFDPENDPALVLADYDWHPGIIGIVAGRLVEKFHRPVILVALDKLGVKPGTGSARSVPGFALHEALAGCSQWLVGHGGHAMAAGLKVEERKLDTFREQFCQLVLDQEEAPARQAELLIDAELPLGLLTHATVEQIESLAPFGQGNRRPLFCATGLSLCEPPKQIGGGGRHLSLRLEQDGVRMRGVAFGGGEWLEELTAIDGPIDVVFRPTINTFQGARRVEVQISDWRATKAAEALS